MAAYSIDEHCLVCNAALTVNGQCPTCDASTIDQSAVVARLDGQKLHATAIEVDFKSAEKRKNNYSSGMAFLFNKNTKERFELMPSVSKIGRDRTNNISLAGDHYISRNHAWILQNKGKFWIEDIGSANGTLLNGRPVSVRTQLSSGDRLIFGKTELIFVVE